MAKLVFAYWHMRGLAEPVRLMLEYAGADYEDKRYYVQTTPPYDRSDWNNVRDSVGLDFPNLPYLIDGDVKITQSWAMARHVARKYGLMPAAGQEHLADMVQGVVEEVRYIFSRMGYENYEGRCENFFGNILPAKLDRFEAFLGKHEWIAGSKLCFVDFALCEYLNQWRTARATALDGHPKVKAYLERFESLDKIKAYRASKRFKETPIHNPQAKWGGTPL